MRVKLKACYAESEQQNRPVNRIGRMLTAAASDDCMMGIVM